MTQLNVEQSKNTLPDAAVVGVVVTVLTVEIVGVVNGVVVTVLSVDREAVVPAVVTGKLAGVCDSVVKVAGIVEDSAIHGYYITQSDTSPSIYFALHDSRVKIM